MFAFAFDGAGGRDIVDIVVGIGLGVTGTLRLLVMIGVGVTFGADCVGFPYEYVFVKDITADVDEDFDGGVAGRLSVLVFELTGGISTPVALVLEVVLALPIGTGTDLDIVEAGTLALELTTPPAPCVYTNKLLTLQ